MKTLIFLTLFFVINFCYAQSEYEKKIIGKWILVEETSDLDDDEITMLGESDSKSELELKTTITFNNDKTIFVNQMGNKYDASYKLIDSILTLGIRKYIIIKIDKKRLTFKDKDGLFDKHYEYKKIE